MFNIVPSIYNITIYLPLRRRKKRKKYSTQMFLKYFEPGTRNLKNQEPGTTNMENQEPGNTEI